VSRRARLAALAVAAVAVAVAVVIAVAPRGRPSLVETPEALARGERVFRAKCLHCHGDVPLARQVAGWTAERAYDAIGRLPQLYPAMPEFHGSDDERRALAVYLSAMGEGRD